MIVDGAKIKRFRESKKLDTQELADAADFRSRRRITQIEAGEHTNINLNIAKAIARKLGVKLEDIAG